MTQNSVEGQVSASVQFTITPFDAYGTTDQYSGSYSDGGCNIV
ncbi:hypothetical protein [Acinetobacter sp. WCHAc010052]|nr:hypothetical protein [Acinetobacter sp. WCHAc010052]